MDQIVEEVVNVSTPISSTSSRRGGGQGDLFQCVNCDSPVDMSSLWYNSKGDLLVMNEEFEKRHQEGQLPLPFSIICSICQYHYVMDKSNSAESARGQEVQQCQADKMIVDVTVGVGDEEDDELLFNPFEIENIVEIILKNMKMTDLKNARLVNNTWNKNAVNLLSTPSRQAKIRPKPFISYDREKEERYEYKNHLENMVQLLKNSENRNIFQKVEFGCSSYNTPLEFDVQNYPQFFKIIEMTQPAHVTYMFNLDYSDLDEKLFTEFLHRISHHVVHLKIHLDVDVAELLLEQDALPFAFPKLKTLEIDEIAHETRKFMKRLLKKCDLLENLKVQTHDWDGIFTVDEFISGLLTPKIAQNLQKLKLDKTAFKFRNLEPHVLFNMNLKSFTVDSKCIVPQEDIFVDCPQLNLFLTSQSESLEKFTIHFGIFENFANREMISDDDQPMAVADINTKTLKLPRLENLKAFKLHIKYYCRGRGRGRCASTGKFWPVQPINLPAILPNLRKIEISYDSRWKRSFMADKPCETVQELVLEDWSTVDNMFMMDLISLFPNVKYLKVGPYVYEFSRYYYRDYANKMHTNLRSIEGWSSTLEKIEIQFEDNFPQNFSFRSISSLPNLNHLYLHQNLRTQDQIEIRPDFTPLFNMKKLSKLVIRNIKISEEIIKELFEKFPKLDYTF